MINLTLGELAISIETLNKIANSTFDEIATSYAVFKILKQVNEELEPYNKALQALYDKLGVPSEDDPEIIRIEPDNVEEFLKEKASLDGQPAELACERLAISKLAGCKLTPAEIGAIEWLIKDDDSDE